MFVSSAQALVCVTIATRGRVRLLIVFAQDVSDTRTHHVYATSDHSQSGGSRVSIIKLRNECVDIWVQRSRSVTEPSSLCDAVHDS